MGSVISADASIGPWRDVAVGELDLVEFIVTVLNFRGAVGDQHRRIELHELVVIAIRAVDEPHVARGKKLGEPVGGFERKPVGLELKGLLYRLVVEHNAVAAVSLGAFDLCLGCGVSAKLGKFDTVEHVGEAQPEVGPDVGIKDGERAATEVDGEPEQIKLFFEFACGLLHYVGMADDERAELIARAVARIPVGEEEDFGLAGVAQSADDMIREQFLVDVFHRWPDVADGHREVAGDGDDAAAHEELVSDELARPDVEDTAVAVEDVEIRGGGAGRGCSFESEGCEAVSYRRHFFLDDGRKVVERHPAVDGIVGFGEDFHLEAREDSFESQHDGSVVGIDRDAVNLG